MGGRVRFLIISDFIEKSTRYHLRYLRVKITNNVSNDTFILFTPYRLL